MKLNGKEVKEEKKETVIDGQLVKTNNGVITIQKSLLKKIAIGTAALVLVGTVGGIAYNWGVNDQNDELNNDVPTPTPTTSIEPSTKPIIEETMIENYADKISAINIQNKNSGLDINSELVNTAILVANLPQFTTEELYQLKLYEKELTTLPYTLLDYIDTVNTHNKTNFTNNYIPLSTLIIGNGAEKDKEMLEELDYEYLELLKILRDSKATDKEKQIAAESTTDYIYNFVCGNGKLIVESGSYDKQNLSAGGGLIAEGYFRMICGLVADKGYGTKDVREKINFIENDRLGIDFDGTKHPNGYITGVYSYDNVTDCYEKALEENTKGSR